MSQVMNQEALSAAVAQELSKILAAAAGNNTQTTTKAAATATYGHGRGGLFSGQGREQAIVSAMPLPNLGLQSILPVKKSNTTDPLYEILTGVTATTGSEPSDVCGTYPRAGLAKLCTHSFVFGLQGRSTQIYNLARIGERQNRGEFLDYNFIGNPFNQSGSNPNVPTWAGGGTSLFGANVANTEEGKAMFEFAVAWARDFARDVFQGNPASNVGEGRKYFYGLDYLINAGYRDAETGVACPAADSKVISFGNRQIQLFPGDMVKLVTAMYVYLQYLAHQVGLAPAKWAIVMPWAMFYELTEVWPCAYQTYRCQVTGENSEAFIDGMKLTEMRDKMRGDINARTGQYLLINGQEVPVILDDGIIETEAAGVRTSQMYFVPLTVVGNTPVTYMEYFDFSAPGAGYEFARKLGYMNYKVSDDGRFFWVAATANNGYCVDAQAITRSRLMLLTPHIAGRIYGISYAPLLANRSPFPGDTYFYNGGRTDRNGLGPNFYTPIA